MVGTSSEHRDALRPGNRERPQLTGGDQIDHRQGCDEHELIGAIEQIADRLRELVVGHVGGAGSGLQLEHLANQMGGVPKPPDEKVSLSGWLFTSATSSETDFAGTQG